MFDNTSGQVIETYNREAALIAAHAVLSDRLRLSNNTPGYSAAQNAHILQFASMVEEKTGIPASAAISFAYAGTGRVLPDSRNENHPFCVQAIYSACARLVTAEAGTDGNADSKAPTSRVTQTARDPWKRVDAFIDAALLSPLAEAQEVLRCSIMEGNMTTGGVATRLGVTPDTADNFLQAAPESCAHVFLSRPDGMRLMVEAIKIAAGQSSAPAA